MTIPVWVLLGFAGWTVLLLLGTIGVYRWSRLATRRSELRAFEFPELTGSDWYKRAMRAHANCLENLPLYAAVVVALIASGVRAEILDLLAYVLLGARVVHTIVHVAFEQTSAVLVLRFSFYAVQLVCMTWMGIHVALAAS